MSMNENKIVSYSVAVVEFIGTPTDLGLGWVAVCGNCHWTTEFTVTVDMSKSARGTVV